jgi:hypothetical protein
LSKLTSDERIWREEQKRLQKEAAERRDTGDTNSKHNHPLNSERRRANRRKPAFTKRNNRGAGNEHNSSGFQMRQAVGRDSAK